MTDEKSTPAPPGVYLRGKTWWIRYRGPRPDGSWGDVRQSAKTQDRERAAKLLKKKNREAENTREGIEGYLSPRSEKLTVGDLLDGLEGWYETKRLRSLREMKVKIAPVREYFGQMRAVAVKGTQISNYIAKRRKAGITKRRKAGIADSTIDHETELLRRAYTVAVKENEILPASFVPKVPRLVKAGSNARQGFFEKDDFEKVVAELPSEVLKDIARWAYATGMRRGETLALSWNGYDRETRVVRLHASNAKTGKGRMIPLSSWPELAAIIDRRMAARVVGCELIFHNGRGQKVGDFFGTFRRACERAKVRDRCFHDLRRTAVRNMVRAGIDPTVAKRISGHETDSIFQRYNIVNEKDLTEALAKRAAYEGRTISRTNDGGK